MSIEKWLGRLGDVIQTSDLDDLRVDCPFCASRRGTADNGKHMYVSVVKPAVHCFRCSWVGHWMGLIISVEGCSYAEALEYLERPAVDIRQFERLYSRRGLVRIDPIIQYPDGFKPFMSVRYDRGSNYERTAVLRYARSRLTAVPNADAIIQKHFGWMPGTNRLWMIIDNGWWQGRSVGASTPKYISPPWPLGGSLWNADALRRLGHVYICEGVFSALHVGQQAIAICSKNLTYAQAERITNAGRVKSVTIMFDADAYEAPYEAATRLESAGFSGKIDVHHLHNGDPVDGLEGDTVEFNLKSRVEMALR